VLDAACGTGVLTRAVAELVGPGGTVVGLDLNEGMLAVARRAAPGVEWRQGSAGRLPFAAGQFDAVVSQFGLMFFEDRPAALREMLRVTRPGGRLAVAVWGSLDETPGYAAMAELLRRLFGDEVAESLRAPYVLGDRHTLHTLFVEAGLPDARITTQVGAARFPSVPAWVHTEIRGWTLADRLDDAQVGWLVAEAERALGQFVTADGTVSFPAPAHIVAATRP
jgi:SAM-dependent methyltransferase